MKLKILIPLTILLLLIFVPLIIPIPQLEGLVGNRTFADEDSKFIEIHDIDIHYKEMGEGEKTYILLHGFGSSTYTWKNVMGELSQNARVIAYDRPAFGLTERPLTWGEFNPYTPESQRDIVIALMDKLDVQEATLIGHSAGGLVSLNTYLGYPERISELILVAPAVYEVNTVSRFVRPLLNIPQIDRLGPLFVRGIERNGEEILKTTWYDPSKITQEDVEEYKKALNIEAWDRALWNLTKSTYSLNPEERLDEIDIPVLIITGNNDEIVDTKNSVRLGNEIPNAKVEIINECGHVPQEECPEEFLKILNERE